MRLWAALLSGCIVGVVGLGACAGWNRWDLPQPGNVAAIRWTERGPLPRDQFSLLLDAARGG